LYLIIHLPLLLLLLLLQVRIVRERGSGKVLVMKELRKQLPSMYVHQHVSHGHACAVLSFCRCALCVSAAAAKCLP
jgi:hypothetical protein